MGASETLSTVTLAQEVDANALEVRLVSSEGLTPGLRLYFDRELMEITFLHDSGRVTVRRGSDATFGAAHASGIDGFVGRADQFFSSDPLGIPAQSVSVTPYINAISGTVWLNQGDDARVIGDRWWQKVTPVYAIDALGIRRSASSVTSEIGNENAQGLPGGDGIRPVSNIPAGINTNLASPFSSPTSLTRKAFLIELKGAANKRLLGRTDVRWGGSQGIEPNAPVVGVHTYNFTQWDAFITWSHDNHVDVLPVFQITPSWAGDSSNGPPDSSHVQDCVDAIVAFMGRYGPGGTFVSGYTDGWAVNCIQIYNEPNLAQHVNAGWTAAKMSALLQLVYPAVKAISADIDVIMPGLTFSPNGILINTFLQQMYNTGVLGSFDYAACHPYSESNPLGANPDIQQIRQKMTNNSDTSKIAITEWGSLGGYRSTVQATACNTLFNVALPYWEAHYGVSKYVLWFSLQDVSTEFGLLTGVSESEHPSGEDPPLYSFRKPSFYVFKDQLLLY